MKYIFATFLITWRVFAGGAVMGAPQVLLSEKGLTYDTVKGLELRSLAEGWTYKAPERDHKTGLRPSRGKHHRGDSHSYVDLAKADIDVPDDYDPREKLGEIRNQGNCGSCWAFSITATHRDAHKLYGEKDPGLLSEQYLVDCATDMYGCNGGMPEAAKWIVQPKGSPLLSDYPYRANDGRCQSKPFGASALEWHYVGNSGSIPSPDEIKKAIMVYGPVSVTVAADNAFSGYRSGVFRGSNRGINHMVNLVGWNKSGGYWIMRNSWGTSWGDNGWMKIAYGANSIGTDTIVVGVTKKPPVPVIREFEINGITVEVDVTLLAENKAKLETAKSIIQTIVNDVDSGR